jgi:hypothetical protein
MRKKQQSISRLQDAAIVALLQIARCDVMSAEERIETLKDLRSQIDAYMAIVGLEFSESMCCAANSDNGVSSTNPAEEDFDPIDPMP